MATSFDTAERLMRVADRHNVSIRFAATDAELLLEIGARSRDISDAIVADAHRLSHQWDERLRQKVWNLNGSWNGQRSPRLTNTAQIVTTRSASGRQKFHGVSTTRLIKWMAGEGFERNEIPAALDNCGIVGIPLTTIAACYSMGTRESVSIPEHAETKFWRMQK